MSPLLWLFIIPFLSSLVAFFSPYSHSRILKYVVVLLSVIPLVLLLSFYPWHDATIQTLWLPGLSVEFYLKIDSLSFIFLLITTIIIPITLLDIKRELPSVNCLYGLILVLQGLLIGFFTARDLALFTIFWEAMLIPLFFIIAQWGGTRKQAAALKFLVYMIAGSTLMVAAVLFLYVESASAGGHASFNIDHLRSISEHVPNAIWLFAIFLLAFAVKTPLFPFHGWLPDAYTQAPVSGSILLSAVLSKAGIYGFFRIIMELFPNFLIEWSPGLLILAIVGLLYGGFAAWAQNDFKRLIAYSSFAHVNFVLIGVFVWNTFAFQGAILQAFNHAITICALFLVASWLEKRLHSTSMHAVQGLAKYLPHLCWLTLFFVLSSVALPGTNSFIGELLIFLGLFFYSHWLTFVAGLTIILSVIYMLKWMEKVYFGTPVPSQKGWYDLTRKEFLIAIPLILLVLWVGIYPAPFLKPIKETADRIENSLISKEAP